MCSVNNRLILINNINMHGLRSITFLSVLIVSHWWQIHVDPDLSSGKVQPRHQCMPLQSHTRHAAAEPHHACRCRATPGMLLQSHLSIRLLLQALITQLFCLPLRMSVSYPATPYIMCRPKPDQRLLAFSQQLYVMLGTKTLKSLG